MQEDIYNVQIDDIFEGPLDLLLHLIKKHEVDIYDIPIALITKQYLKYIEWMKIMNIDIAGDFIVMASTLTKIKSRMLLPSHEEEDEEDPRLELVKPIEEYLLMKSAAEKLAARSLLGEDTFVRNPRLENHLMDHEGEIIPIGLFELIDAFQRILENISPHFETRGSTTFNELFPKDAEQSEVIVTFLAILEMVRLSLVRIIQNTRTGIIRLFYL